MDPKKARHTSKPPRLVAVIHSTDLFGHEQGMLEALRAIREGGSTVTVLGAEGEHEVRAAVTESEFPFVPAGFRGQWSLTYLRKEGPSYALKNLRSLHKVSRSLERLCRSTCPSMLLIGNPAAFSYCWPALARTRLPLISRLGDCPPTASRFQLALWRKWMGRSSRCVANSQFVRRESQAALSGRQPHFSVIYNHPRSNSHSSRVSHVARRGACRFLFVGSFAPHKGLHVALEAASYLRGLGHRFRLRAYGGRPGDENWVRLTEQLRRLDLHEMVELHSHRSELGQEWAWADVHLMPSIWQEPSGNALVEAKFFGRPSICFDLGGMPEHIQHGVNGWVISEVTGPAFGAYMELFIKQPGLSREMGEAARMSYATQFGRERFVREWRDELMAAQGEPVSGS